MAYTCTLYSGFTKRINSTKQPTGGVTYPCNIKHDTDFKNPVLEITAEDLSDVNYMQFNGDFFYVTSVIAHRNNVYEVAGSRDPMASYKAAIGSTSAFLMYSGNAFDAGAAANRVPDERLQINRVPEVSWAYTQMEGTKFALRPQTGSFLLSAVGENGGVASYVLTLSAMRSLLNNLGLDTQNRLAVNWNVQSVPASVEAALTDIRNGLWETLANELAYGNYSQAIKACYWIPFIGFTGDVDEVYLGDYPTGVRGLVVGSVDKILTETFNVEIPWPVDDWKRNNCLVQLYLPFCGTVVLPVDKINNDSSIAVIVAVDAISGNISFQIKVGGVTYNVSGSNAAAPYAIGSSNITAANFMNGVASVVGGGISAVMGVLPFMSGDAAGGITSVAAGIQQAITPQIQCAGSVGGISAAGLEPMLACTVQYYAPIEPANFQSLYGHPVMCVRTPDAGYNMFRGFAVECAGTPDEMTQINSFFNSGAFYE